MMERVKLIDSLDEEDKTALIRVIDSMLTKKKILNLVTKENIAESVASNSGYLNREVPLWNRFNISQMKTKM